MNILSMVEGAYASLIFILGIVFLYIILIFLVGLMLYYFTGKDRMGAGILANFGRIATRAYNHLWMFIASFTAMVGFALFTKSILGALFEGFVYTTRRFSIGSGGETMQQVDLKAGIVLFIVSIMIYLAHWGFNYYIESSLEKQGTVVSKLFTGIGLFVSSLVFYGAFILFVFALVAGAPSGGILAWIIAGFPLWALYAYKSYMFIRREQ